MKRGEFKWKLCSYCFKYTHDFILTQKDCKHMIIKLNLTVVQEDSKDYNLFKIVVFGQFLKNNVWICYCQHFPNMLF